MAVQLPVSALLSVSISGLALDKQTSVAIANRANSNCYLPYYSYDNKSWARFSEAEVLKSVEGD